MAADGVLLVTPEYNNSIPGVFKNTIDWLSRPNTDARRVFGGRRFAIIGASPGAFGTILSQTAWLPVMRTLGAQLWTGGRLMVSRANNVFDEGGTLKDATIEEALRQFLGGYVAFLRGTPAAALAASGVRLRLGRGARERRQRLQVRADRAQPRIGRKVALLPPRVVHLRHEEHVRQRHRVAEHVAAVAAGVRDFLLERREAARDPVRVPGVHVRIRVPERCAQVVEHAQVVQRMDVAGDR